jgi:hypothetical protein
LFCPFSTTGPGRKGRSTGYQCQTGWTLSQFAGLAPTTRESPFCQSMGTPCLRQPRCTGVEPLPGLPTISAPLTWTGTVIWICSSPVKRAGMSCGTKTRCACGDKSDIDVPLVYGTQPVSILLHVSPRHPEVGFADLPGDLARLAVTDGEAIH